MARLGGVAMVVTGVDSIGSHMSMALGGGWWLWLWGWICFGLFLFHLFWVNETSSIKLGINETYFDLWSMGGIEDLG